MALSIRIKPSKRLVKMPRQPPRLKRSKMPVVEKKRHLPRGEGTTLVREEGQERGETIGQMPLLPKLLQLRLATKLVKKVKREVMT